MDVDLFLASQSPRRQELLNQLGVRFAVRSQDVPETRLPGESPENFVQRLAVEKADNLYQTLPLTEQRPVLGADTVVVSDGEILGKPVSQENAMAMLQQLSGRTHQVMTGVAVVSRHQSVCVNVSEVTFRQLSLEEIEAYWNTGEPVDKAGAYAIQGYAAAFIKGLAGSYSGVMGLPLYETAQLLAQHDVPVWQR
jgi:septum formation protein